MAGLLGSLVAGGVKGYADNRANDLRREEAFNLQMALQDAASEKQLKLKQAGIEMEEKQLQARKDKVSSIANSVTDPMEGKGGYESEEDSANRKRGLLSSKADALADAGELDAAKVYYGRADVMDKSEMTKAQLELKQEQILGTIKNAQERNRIYEELGDAKNATQLAKMEAAAAKANAGGGKVNEAQARRSDFIEAYAKDPKYVVNGKLTGAGYDKLNKLNDDNDTQKVTEEPVLNFQGNVRMKDGKPMMTRKITRTEPIPKTPSNPAPTKSGKLVLDKNGNYVFNR